MIDLPELFASAAELFDVSDGAIREGRGRNARMVGCRQAIAYVLAEHNYTTVEIGVILRRDHSTICYALKQARQRIKDDVAFAKHVRALAAAIDTAKPQTVATVVAARQATDTIITAPLRLALAWWGLPSVSSA